MEDYARLAPLPVGINGAKSQMRTSLCTSTWQTQLGGGSNGAASRNSRDYTGVDGVGGAAGSAGCKLMQRFARVRTISAEGATIIGTVFANGVCAQQLLCPATGLCGRFLDQTGRAALVAHKDTRMNSTAQALGLGQL